MTLFRIFFVFVIGLSALAPQTVSAWTCQPLLVIAVEEDRSSTDAEILRMGSHALSERYKYLGDGDVLVVGKFAKHHDLPFLHEEQVDDIRAKYWPRSQTVHMPSRITYVYVNSYRFEGHQILDGTLVPFATENIDVSVDIAEEYEGIMGVLPPTEDAVFGILRGIRNGKAFEASAYPCPSYVRIEPAQLADFLACQRGGECK